MEEETCIDSGHFTLARYRRIVQVKYKTFYYSFYLPVAMGMLLGGVTDAAAFASARDVCEILGEYFQIQDDYLDCFGDRKIRESRLPTFKTTNALGWWHRLWKVRAGATRLYFGAKLR